MGVNKYGERISPYDLAAVHRQEQRILARKRAMERLVRAEQRRDPYNPPRIMAPKDPATQ